MRGEMELQIKDLPPPELIKYPPPVWTLVYRDDYHLKLIHLGMQWLAL